MTAARIKRASNFTLQRTMASRCSRLAAERRVRRQDCGQTRLESLEASLVALAELEAVHLRLGKEMFEAFGGAMYGMDLLRRRARSTDQRLTSLGSALYQSQELDLLRRLASPPTRHGHALFCGLSG